MAVEAWLMGNYFQMVVGRTPCQIANEVDLHRMRGQTAERGKKREHEHDHEVKKHVEGASRTSCILA
jgi:AraC-like DNA-binding protein